MYRVRSALRSNRRGERAAEFPDTPPDNGRNESVWCGKTFSFETNLTRTHVRISLSARFVNALPDAKSQNENVNLYLHNVCGF